MTNVYIMLVFIFIVSCGTLAGTVATYFTIRSYFRSLRPADVEKAIESGSITEVPAQGLKYHEPPTESLFVVEDKPRPPFPAPMVDGETVKQWMIHLYNNDNIWAMFTDAFYIRVMSRPIVRRLFPPDRVEDIKKNFLSHLLILCDKGVSEQAAATLIKLHKHLNMTVAQYDSTMEALEETLVQYRVPEETIAQFVPLIDYFRDEMTVDA